MDYNFISFPRSGSHFFNNVLRTYLGGQKGYAQHVRHDHDEHLTVKIIGAVHLYRGIEDTLYSYLVAEHFLQDREGIDFEEYREWLIACNGRIVKHRGHYIENSSLNIFFEDLKSRPLETYWPQVFEFFKVPLDMERLRKAVEENTKDRLADKIGSMYMNKKMLTPLYEENRIAFKKYYELKLLRG
jgi:hypothetical protein